MSESILSFRGEYRFLSNFYPCAVDGVDGYVYPSVEHAYQAAKVSHYFKIDRAAELVAQIRMAETARAAKKIGQAPPMPEGWTADKRVSVMKLLVERKFTRHDILKQRLLATGDARLEEGNDWGDAFWGVTRTKNGAVFGLNHLGKILMTVREQLATGNLR